MSTTTSYGTWCNRVAQYSTSPDQDVRDYISTGDPAWAKKVEETGALAEMQAAYRRAINAALPPSIALCGDEFIGPASPEEGEFTSYPTAEGGGPDFYTMIDPIDLGEIVDRYDPENNDD